MDYEFIYLYGVLATYLLALYDASQETGEDRAIEEPAVIFLGIPVYSLLSWWGLVVILAFMVNSEKNKGD